MKLLRAAVFPVPAILSILALALPAQAIPEPDFDAIYARDVVPFLATGERVDFTARDGLKLSAIHYRNPEASKGTVILLPGRTETWMYYGEMAHDLHRLGYGVFAYDHRGQGLSPHLVAANRQIGHVDRFEQYADDLETFLKSVVLPATRMPSGEQGKLFLFGHSMGGAIAVDYLSRENSRSWPGKKSVFSGVVLSAPMLEINTDPYAPSVAYLLVATEVARGNARRYARGHGDARPDSAGANAVTSSEVRAAKLAEIEKANPEVTLGGPSNGWVHQSLLGLQRIRTEIRKTSAPILLLQAGKDRIVKPGGQNQACRRAQDCRVLLLPESLHDVFLEKDIIRDRALSALDSFFTGKL